jgi:hypothetical protein
LIVRQVPEYLVIGHGRVARHFLHYFSLLDIPAVHWHRGMPAHAIPDASRTLLLIADRAIDKFCDEFLQGRSGTTVHFSGSLVTDKAVGAHPLMTFGPQLYTLDKYKKIPFVVDEGVARFEELLPGLPNPHVSLPTELKAKYHALCVLSGNFTTILWQKMFSSLKEDLGLPPEIAKMYLQQTVENLLTDPENALTGPLARGDSETVARNLAALKGDPFRKIYQSFIEAYSTKKEKAS